MNFNVPDLLKHDYIFVTRQGLIDLEDTLAKRETNYYRNRKRASEAAIMRAQAKTMDKFERDIIKPILESEEIEGYDDNLPLSIQSESLKSYVDDLQRLQHGAAAESEDKESK